ncbi:MAG: sodium:proline symporter [Leptolyngbya foveolarum]|uniref:Sodium:proline symporter n=1 Tax=Leptolyngbya foveolarum TaxID=47253 RepID=A0A2W4WI91_9CYAN|nr:MAG: sodium:proline symporter [Leptolyngbya foveolarum]
MQSIDWVIVISYLVLTMILGIYLARRASGGMVDFFVSGRSLPWWLAGTSMAATTFSIDTPLYIAGVVGNRGIAGNWEWWSFGVAHVVMIYVFARMWRRSEIVTDAELTELRYGGNTAAVLRGTKAFLFAVPINCIGIGYSMLAMTKVVDALQLWQSVGIEPNESNKLFSVIGISALVLVYAGFSGLWGVVATDFFQFFLALFGAVVVAIAAVNSPEIGGMRSLVDQFTAATNPEMISFIPLKVANGGIEWSALAGIPSSTFLAYVFLQWWSFRRSDGGGEFVQRLAASKTEAEAEKAAWFFNLLHYVVRTWPWIIVALAAVVIYPNLEDRELGYPMLMLDYLPPVMLGLVVASLIAAFMSTVSTLINWGASYLTNDLYGRFISPDATQSELVFAGRIASVLVTILGGVAAFISTDVATVFRLVIAIGTGPGLVLILRWFWWRINAAAELAAMVGGFIVGFFTSVPAGQAFFANVAPWINIDSFGIRLLVTSVITTVIWVATLLLTPPESPETLDSFYTKVRPGGPGWANQRQRTGIPPQQNLNLDIQRVLASILLLFGSMLAVGGFLLLQSLTGWISLVIAVIGGFWLRQLSKRPNFPMGRPGTEDG